MAVLVNNSVYGVDNSPKFNNDALVYVKDGRDAKYVKIKDLVGYVNDSKKEPIKSIEDIIKYASKGMLQHKSGVAVKLIKPATADTTYSEDELKKLKSKDFKVYKREAVDAKHLVVNASAEEVQQGILRKAKSLAKVEEAFKFGDDAKEKYIFAKVGRFGGETRLVKASDIGYYNQQGNFIDCTNTEFKTDANADGKAVVYMLKSTNEPVTEINTSVSYTVKDGDYEESTKGEYVKCLCVDKNNENKSKTIYVQLKNLTREGEPPITKDDLARYVKQNFAVKAKIDGKITNLKINSDKTFAKLAEEKLENGKFTKIDVTDYVAKEGEEVTVPATITNFKFKKEDKKRTFETRQYKLRTDDNAPCYIKVRLKGDTADSLVDVTKLRQSVDGVADLNKAIKLEELTAFVGKEVYVLDEGNKPQPVSELTPEQVLVKYQPKFSMQETTADSSVCADNACLMLKNGQFVKEKEVVRPKCYNFCAPTEKNFYGFLIKTRGTRRGEDKSFIVTKAEALKLQDNAGNVVIRAHDGTKLTFNVNNTPKIVEASSTSKCDIVQTTSVKGRAVEQCEVLRSYEAGNYPATPENLDETQKARLEELFKQFLQDYKNGKYEIDKIFVNDKFVEYLQNHRYLWTDVFESADPSDKLKQYANFVSSKYTYEDGKLKGTPKYDAKKGIKDGFAKWGKAMAYGFAFWGSVGGVIAALVSPAALIAVGVGLVAAVGAIPAFHLIKKSVVERKQNFVNKAEIQRKKIKDEVFEGAQELLEQVQTKFAKNLKEAQKTAQKAENSSPWLSEDEKQLFLTQTALLEQKLALLTSSKNGAEFRVVDGKADVTEANAHEYSAYRQMIEEKSTNIAEMKHKMDSLESKMKKLKKKGKTAEYNDLNKEYSILSGKHAQQSNELEYLKKNYTSSGTDNATDKEYETLKAKLDQLKGFMLCKYFGDAKNDKRISNDIFNTTVAVDTKHHDIEYTRESIRKQTHLKWKKEWNNAKKNDKVTDVFATKGSADDIEIGISAVGNHDITLPSETTAQAEQTAEAEQPNEAEPTPDATEEEKKKEEKKKRAQEKKERNLAHVKLANSDVLAYLEKLQVKDIKLLAKKYSLEEKTITDYISSLRKKVEKEKAGAKPTPTIASNKCYHLYNDLCTHLSEKNVDEVSA